MILLRCANHDPPPALPDDRPAPGRPGRSRLMYTPSALAMRPLTTAMPGQRKASELFKRSCTYYSCNAPASSPLLLSPPPLLSFIPFWPTMRKKCRINGVSGNMYAHRSPVLRFLREFSVLCVVSRGERSSLWNSPPRARLRIRRVLLRPSGPPRPPRRLLLHLQVRDRRGGDRAGGCEHLHSAMSDDDRAWLTTTLLHL